MKPIKDLRIKHYCTGCGLCQAMGKAVLEYNKKGFAFPVSGDQHFLSVVCPSTGKRMDNMDLSSIWGRVESVYFGWSNDEEIRTKASSGGILTELSIYLLETGKIDVVIQSGANPDCPTKADTFFSYTSEDVLRGAGSRYSISHPLSIINLIDKTKRYLFIGRPCDVTALRNYIKVNPEIETNIIYMFSFFCMGTPSNDAQKQLLNSLNCENCNSLTYRGNGWPGKTIAINDIGVESSMDYNTSWGEILGRDLMPMCRFCIDGIGEEADISCGDAWYVLDDGTPDFSEHKGRNIIFARTRIGDSLLKELNDCEKISLSRYKDYENQLKLIQKSQFDRRRNMFARIAAMKFFLKPCPNYPMVMLKQYARYSTFKDFFKTYAGTLRRVIKKKI